MTKKSSPTPEKLSSPDSFPRFTDLGNGCPRVLRLGLATRGNTHLSAASVRYAVERGVNYLNWCGYDDGIREAVGELDRTRIVLATQLYAHRGPRILRELEKSLKDLKTEWLDVVTFYYMESETEWAEISGPGGALEALRGAQQQGKVRCIGLTTHQRALGTKVAETGAVDLLMIRYNAAHRGAEQDVFPLTRRMKIPVVCYTALRWGGLLKPTQDDPPGFKLPPAPEWYRFALANPAANIVLAAPNDHKELEQDLGLLDDWRSPRKKEFERMATHGQRVRKHAGTFP